MPSCDIIIPTYNNSQVISHTLAALNEQNIPSNWQIQIVIIDDGSQPPLKLQITNYPASDGTPSAGGGKLQITVLHQKHAGAATARNRGLKESSADILLFLGADILLRPNALTEHLTFHEQNPDKKHAALGMVKWDPRLHPTPFMEWMIHGGQQNDFDTLLGKNIAAPEHFFYGSHISVKRSIMSDVTFPTIYKQYGWEDLDVGCQLKAKGLQLSVLHQAVGLHRHGYTANQIYKRQYRAGQGLTTFKGRHETTLKFPTLSRRAHQKLIFYRMPIVRTFLKHIIGTLSQSKSLPWLFMATTTAEFWLGEWKNVR